MKSKIVLCIRWVLTAFFALMGLALLTTGPAAGLIGLVLAAFVSPLSPKMFGKFTFLDNRWKKVVTAILLFFAMVFASPSAETPTASTSGTTTQITESAATEVETTVTPEPATEPATTETLVTSPTPTPTAEATPTPTPTPTATPKPTPQPTVKAAATTVPTATPKPAPVQKKSTPTPKPAAQSGSWTCDCSKTCPNMSYEEAQYQLNTCGCSRRDGDKDGIACDR